MSNVNDYMLDSSNVLQKFFGYLLATREYSSKTVMEYYKDLRTFFRFYKVHKNLVDKKTDFSEISINDVDIKMLSSVTISDLFIYTKYLMDDRSNSAATRSRKISSLHTLYNYLVEYNFISENPVATLKVPKKAKKLPKYLSLEQSLELLNAVDGQYKERDYCMLTLFLNCGIRLSELVNLDVNSINRYDHMMNVTGKGNKERIVYLNDACMTAIEAYLRVRPDTSKLKNDRYALFISRQFNRVSVSIVQKLVHKYLQKIGLDNQGYSVHKLRHTAATLMYQTGNVDIRVLKDILGHENLGTTEIYTHLSNEQMKNAADANPLSKVKKPKQ